MAATFRQLLRAWLGVTFLVTPIVADPGHDHGPANRCEHRGEPTSRAEHGHPAPSDCTRSDACQDCAAPSCRTATHCGGAPTMVPAPDAPAAPAAGRQGMPNTIRVHLLSIGSAPPTHPPRLSR